MPILETEDFLTRAAELQAAVRAITSAAATKPNPAQAMPHVYLITSESAVGNFSLKWKRISPRRCSTETRR